MTDKLPAVRSKPGSSQGEPGKLWARLEGFLSMRAPTTYETYKGVLREWSEFLGAELGSTKSYSLLLEATDLHAMAYVKWLGRQRGELPRILKSGSTARSEVRLPSSQRTRTSRAGLDSNQSNATITKKIAALRRIYRMLVSAGLVNNGNPFDSDKIIPPPRESGRKRPTEMVPFLQVKKVIEGADTSTLKGLQDRAILACLFGGALRRSEVTILRLGDVRRTPSGTVFLYLRATKAGKDAQQALPKWAAKAVVEFIAERTRQVGGQKSTPLFCSFRGKGGQHITPRPLTNSGVYKLFKLYCAKAALEGFFTPHSARATAITRLLAEGIPHREVQEFSRHSSIQMVELYDKRRIGVDESVAKDLEYD